MNPLGRLQSPLETDEQQALFAWAGLMESRMPELQDLFAVPNGAYKSRAMASRFKREGLKAGVPDIVLPHARKGCNSLYIEMKRRQVAGVRVALRKAPSVLSAEQLDWHRRLQAAGNMVVVAYGWEEARVAIEAYLAL